MQKNGKNETKWKIAVNGEYPSQSVSVHAKARGRMHDKMAQNSRRFMPSFVCFVNAVFFITGSKSFPAK